MAQKYTIRRSGDDAEAIIFIIRLLICLFVSIWLLANLGNLQSCVPRMDVLVLGQNLIFWFILPSMLCECTRRTAGAKIGTGLYALCLLWTFVMCVCMIISSFTNRGACWSFARGASDLIIEYIAMMLALTAYGVFKFYELGFYGFNRHFYDQESVLSDLAGIRDGRIRAQTIIAEQKNLDKFSLFDTEKELMITECTVSSSDEIEKLQGTDCSVCLCSIDQKLEVLRFPHCGHYFHKDCIMKWLQEHTVCPNCRGGVRSYLYLELESKRSLKPTIPIGETTDEIMEKEFGFRDSLDSKQDPLLK